MWFVVIQLLSCVWFWGIPWTAACQVSLPFTICLSLLRLMFIESVMTSNHLLHHPLLLPSIFPSMRFISNESILCIRWPKYWSFSISPSKEYSELVSFKIDWYDLLAVQETLKSLLQHHNFKSISVLQCSPMFSLVYGPILTSVHDYWKNHSFDYTDLCWQSDVSVS